MQLCGSKKKLKMGLSKNNITQVTQIVTDLFKYLSVRVRVFRVLCVLILMPVLSTVFVIDHDLANGVVSGKYFWFYGSMGILSIISCTAIFIYKPVFRFSILDLLVIGFFANVYISSLLINDASQNTTKLVILALLLVLYFNFSLFFKHEDTNTQRYIYFFLILTGLVEAIWGLRQLYGFSPSQHSLFRLTGSFFNPGPYAGYLAVVFPLALYFALKLRIDVVTNDAEQSRFIELHRVLIYLLCNGVRFISIATCITILLVLPAAMSRASWLAAIAGSLIVLTGYYSNRFAHIKKYLSIDKKKVLAVSIIVIALLFLALSGMYFLKKDSADGRALMWKISLDVIKKHPFGVGLGNFSGAYGDAQAVYFASGQASETEEYVAGSPEYAFNEYLQIAIETGLLSLLLFLAIIVVALRKMIKTKAWGKMGALVSLLVFACFSYPFSVLPFLIIFVFLIYRRSNTDDTVYADSHGFLNEKTGVNPFIPCLLCAFICLTITSFCLYKEYPVYQAYKSWNTARIYYNAGLYKDVAEDYKELYPLLNDQIQFLFEYAQSLSKSEQYAESNRILERAIQISCDPMLYNIMGKNYQALKAYEQAEVCFIQSTRIVPNRLYPFYLLTKLYHEMGSQEKVNEMADIVQTKEPKVHSRAVEEMREEVQELKTKS